MSGLSPSQTPLPLTPPPSPGGGRGQQAPPSFYPPLWRGIPRGAPPNPPGLRQQTNSTATPLRTAVKPTNKGGIITDAQGNETPFTGKGRSLTLPGGLTETVPASVWATRPPPEDTRFYRDFENKLEKGTGVIFSGTDTTDDNDKVQLDDWRKVLYQKMGERFDKEKK